MVDSHLKLQNFPVSSLKNLGPTKDVEYNSPEVGSAPQDSGRTRSSARRMKQESAASNEASGSSIDSENCPAGVNKSSGSNNRGRKRKRSGGDDSDSDDDNQKDNNKESDHTTAQPPVESTQKELCCGRNDVMKCIGILPSLPIMNNFMEYSSDTDSSINEELNHTVLPRVNRTRETGAE